MLNLRQYLVREHVGLLKLHEAFDVLDPATGALVGTAIEHASTGRKMLKLVVSKNLLPFEVQLVDAEQQLILTIKRGFTLFRSRIEVRTRDGQLMGTFQQRFFSIGGRFDIYDAAGQKFAELKGNLIGWNFRFIGLQGEELGRVTRQWGGIGKELFTSADNYVVALAPQIDPVGIGPLLLAAALCIDLALKESGGGGIPIGGE